MACSSSELISESKDRLDISGWILIHVIGSSQGQTENRFPEFLIWLEHSWSVVSSSEWIITICMYFILSVRIHCAQYRPTVRVSSETSETQVSLHHPMLEMEEETWQWQRKASFREAVEKIWDIYYRFFKLIIQIVMEQNTTILRVAFLILAFVSLISFTTLYYGATVRNK